MRIGQRKCNECGWIGSTSINDKCWCDREDIKLEFGKPRNPINTLVLVRSAILNAPDDAFGFSEEDFGDGKLVKYPLKDELLNEINETLKENGISL